MKLRREYPKTYVFDEPFKLPSCAKKTFDKKDAAIKRADEINRKNIENGDKTVLRQYFCLRCKKFHLTSMDKNMYKKITRSIEIYQERKRNKEVEYWEAKLNLNY